MKITVPRIDLRTAIVMVLCACIVACGGDVSKTILPTASATFKHLTTGQGSYAYKPEAGVKSMALFQTSAPAASQLQQSFSGRCSITADHSQVSSTSLVPIPIGLGNTSCNGFFGSPSDAFGTPVIFAGTFGTLSVLANSEAPIDPTTGTSPHLSSNLQCKDLTNVGPALDQTFVSVYLRPSDNVILIFDGPSQLATTCHVPVPSGEVITDIQVGFLKS